MPKRKLFSIAVTAIILAVIAFYTQKFSRTEKNSGLNTLTIGAILPLTGFGAYEGEYVKRGMELALNDYNQEKLKVNLIFEDSAGEPLKAANAAQKLISISNADALFVEFTGPAGAAAPIVKQANKIFYYHSLDPQYALNNDYAFKTFFNVNTECKKIGDYASKNKIEKVAYVGPKLSFVRTCVLELEKILGEDRVIVETVIDPKTTDFRTQLAKVKNQRAELIISLAYQNNYIGILKQKLELGINAPLFCMKSDCWNEETRKVVDADAYNGTIIFDFDVEPAFIDRIKILYPGLAEASIKPIAQGYDAISYIVRGFSNCQPKNVECAAKQIMADTAYNAKILGSQFTEKRLLNAKTKYFKIIDGQAKEIEL